MGWARCAKMRQGLAVCSTTHENAVHSSILSPSICQSAVNSNMISSSTQENAVNSGMLSPFALENAAFFSPNALTDMSSSMYATLTCNQLHVNNSQKN